MGIHEGFPEDFVIKLLKYQEKLAMQRSVGRNNPGRASGGQGQTRLGLVDAEQGCLPAHGVVPVFALPPV